VYPDAVAKVRASGKTPAGSHVPIMVAGVLEALAPTPGETGVDATLGYGGHARALLERLQPGGFLLGLDVDPLELPRTEARLRALGYGETAFRARRSNFAGLPQALTAEGLAAVDLLLADLGVSSMQLDTPERGFSVKIAGPLDMRMNPHRGQPASAWLAKASAPEFARLLVEAADEPDADAVAAVLAGRTFATTTALADAIREARPDAGDDAHALTIRRVFQALRIVVNDEFGALDMLLRHLPSCLAPGGRVVILSFHSGEDRRVKHAFEAGLREGAYAAVSDGVLRPDPAERRDNPRASAAKLRWARKD
jgi:16S rRNA (cytosine1402-N4)-methyltransferase